MFGRRKKEIKIDNVKTFKDAVKVIKTYVYLQEWEKASQAIQDIRKKEETAFKELEYKIRDDYSEIQKQRRIYDKNMHLIEKIEKD